MEARRKVIDRPFPRPICSASSVFIAVINTNVSALEYFYINEFLLYPDAYAECLDKICKFSF